MLFIFYQLVKNVRKGTRLYTKEQYLEWGLAWLKNPNRQKRKPRKT